MSTVIRSSVIPTRRRGHWPVLLAAAVMLVAGCAALVLMLADPPASQAQLDDAERIGWQAGYQTAAAEFSQSVGDAYRVGVQAGQQQACPYLRQGLRQGAPL